MKRWLWLRALPIPVLLGLAFLIEPYLPIPWKVVVSFNLGMIAAYLLLSMRLLS